MRTAVIPVSAVLPVVLAATLVACGSPRRGAPFVEAHPTGDPQLLVGERIFARNCSPCHVGGTAGLGPALNDKPLPGGLVEFQVRNGLGAMPGFSEEEISDAELDALVAYLGWLRDLEPRGLQPHEPESDQDGQGDAR